MAWKRFGRQYIGELVYGANDGIITTFAVVAGAAGAGLSSSIIIMLGVANLLADGFSMGASSFLAKRSEQSREGEEGTAAPLQGALVTFGAFIVAGALPLLPFIVLSGSDAVFAISAVGAGIAFFLVGSARALVIPKHPLIAGMEMLLIGAIAAGISYGIGSFVEQLLR
ncbi:MAG: VIT1/CCC1 transporter family protein [Candidatus Pacebacteria bacterium]|nr:VIT1/CCC1 transporter family protein [Candidatus Paceibacterota bacterium]